MQTDLESDAAPATIERDVHCPGCGYNLRGTDGLRCPECGRSHDVEALLASQIPWTHRRSRGRIRSYFGTLRYVTLNNLRFCEEIVHNVSYRDAQRFRWVTIVLIYLLVAAATVVFFLSGALSSFDIEELGGWPTIIPALVVLHGSVLFFLAAITGAPTYFFHARSVPVDIQNRGIALSYYTCGQLWWLLPTLLLGAVTYALQDGGEFDTAILAAIASAVFAAATIFGWPGFLYRLAARCMGTRRAVWMLILLPPIWLALAALILVAIPLSVFHIAVIFASL